eukprot:11762997-Alexandrium_andersonii.AAC.1
MIGCAASCRRKCCARAPRARAAADAAEVRRPLRPRRLLPRLVPCLRCAGPSARPGASALFLAPR